MYIEVQMVLGSISENRMYTVRYGFIPVWYKHCNTFMTVQHHH